jgi:hypothetical protein
MGRGCLRVGIGPHTKRLRDKETTKRRRDEATKRRRGDGYVHDRAADWSLATPAKVRAEAMKKGHRGLTTWRRQRMSGERVHGVHTPDPSSRLLETPRDSSRLLEKGGNDGRGGSGVKGQNGWTRRRTGVGQARRPNIIE